MFLDSKIHFWIFLKIAKWYFSQFFINPTYVFGENIWFTLKLKVKNKINIENVILPLDDT